MALRLTILLIVISLVFEKCNCTKDEDCLGERYSFEISVQASPDLDSIFINDTIWFEIDEPINLKDLSTNKIVNFSNANNLGSVIGFDELLGNSQRRDAAIDFNYVLISGVEVNSINPLRFREYAFKEEAARYIFRLGVVPKKTGIFRIGFSDADNVYRNNNNCSKAFFKLNFKQTNQHLYLNDQNFGITTPLPNNMYCFKVK